MIRYSRYSYLSRFLSAYAASSYFPMYCGYLVGLSH